MKIHETVKHKAGFWNKPSTVFYETRQALRDDLALTLSVEGKIVQRVERIRSIIKETCHWNTEKMVPIKYFRGYAYSLIICKLEKLI